MSVRFTGRPAWPFVNRLCLLILFLLPGISHSQQTETPIPAIADFVWSEEFAGGSRILHSRYAEGRWGNPATVFEGSGLYILPSVAAVSEADMAIVWSSVTPKGIALYFSRTVSTEQSSDISWSKGAVLTDKRTVNLASVLLALNGGYRAFWSAHEGGDDDILSSTLIPSGWTEPRLVHPENSSMDVLPLAGFSKQSDVWLRWESIDENTINNPVLVFNTNSARETSADTTIDAIELDRLLQESMQEIDLEPPSFFSSKSRSTMYIHGLTTHPVRFFPGNLLP